MIYTLASSFRMSSACLPLTILCSSVSSCDASVPNGVTWWQFLALSRALFFHWRALAAPATPWACSWGADEDGRGCMLAAGDGSSVMVDGSLDGSDGSSLCDNQAHLLSDQII